MVTFAVAGAALLTPWHVEQHGLLCRTGDRKDLKTRIIRGGAVLGVAARNGLAGWLLGSAASLLLWLWAGPWAGLWLGLGVAVALTVVLGTLYRALLGVARRAGE